ncbi:MAG: endopeptidase La [Waddliaceae bacterium]|nr:endopeptidase La [Waddliaceae bacterium]
MRFSLQSLSDDDILDSELEETVIDSLSANRSTDPSVKSPDKVFIFPLLRRPFFPGMAAPIVVEPGPFYEVLKKVSKTDHKCVGLLLAKSEEADIYKIGLKDLHEVGVLARILRIIPMEQGGAQVVLNMEKRLIVDTAVKRSKYLQANVSYYEDPADESLELKAYSISIISTIKELLKLNPLFKEELQIFLGHSEFTEPGKLADFAVTLTTASRDELQKLLETFDIRERVDCALTLLKNELDLSHLQHKINQQIESSITKSQKEFFLREQLRTIKRELGIEKDEKVCDREKFEARIAEREIPEDTLSIINDELEKLSSLDMQSAEYSVSRGYLDWLTILPWGLQSEECHDLRKAQKVLEEDHYGLEDIKERIIEFIGVGTLAGGVRGSIICLVGPPGVGKTSIGRSIARALNRKFYRFSVGGMRDEAEIKGHRRTYIGAMPGKIMQALKISQTMNPVIMLDEVDKMGKSFQGDPGSALLEVLDPEQNKEFMDHFLDVPVDLSNVLFIVTANTIEEIPGPLLDRMEVMRLSGYITQEKLAIASKYLVPRNRKEMGLKAKDVVFTKEGLRYMINGYAREAGVRTLEKKIKKILRKIAVNVVREQQKKKRKATTEVSPPTRITAKNIGTYLGKPDFTSERFYETTPTGVAMGLAWTAMGGATLYIESIKVPAEKTSMHLTGQAGDVMKESSKIAWSYLHSAVHKYCPEFTFFEGSTIHMHIPEGAVPKDGPSAGITMVTSLLSLLMNRPIKCNLAMTGELTLTGRVLPVGGIREKIIASRRSDAFEIILPATCKSDVAELPKYILEGLTIHFVEHYDEVFKIAFPQD